MVAEKKEKLIEMVKGFSNEYLDEEYMELNIRLVEKLARKHDVPFRRGKLENWAGGIVYAIGQLNFLFDDSTEPYATPDDISDYFGVKKKTAANKARDIRKLLNLKLGDEEFSTELVLESDVSRMGGNLSQVKTLHGAQRYSRLRELGDMMKILNSQNPNDDLEKFIDDTKGNIDHDELPVFYELLRDSTFIIPHHDGYPVVISDQNGTTAIVAFTSEERYNLDGDFKIRRMKFMKAALFFGDDSIEGLVLNPGSQTLFISRYMIREVIFGR
nr:DUF6398 domain-containing protein [uncultured Methanobrevibacter sp.]